MPIYSGMRIWYFLAVFFLCAVPASAEPYVKVNTWIANSTEINAGNVGGAIAVGYDAGAFRFEAELSNHTHLGDATIAAMLQGCVDIGDWVVEPYVCVGGGSTIEDWRFDEMAIQGTAGVAFHVSDSMAITTEILQRCYGSLSDFCDSRDVAVTIGLRVGF